MPELPEVETIVSELNLKTKNKAIKAVEVRAAKITDPGPEEFSKKLQGKKIISVRRRAKMIIFHLSGGDYLLSHLKMTGQFVFIGKKGKAVSGGHPIGNIGQLPNKFSHVIFDFKDGSKLFFNDIRRFGWIRLVSKTEMEKAASKYGLEPLSKEFTNQAFIDILKKYPKRKIKQLLLDQSLISGIGNIYCDEACFCAGILPMRISGSLKKEEMKKLHRCIVRILKFAVLKKGTSANTYILTDGSRGSMVKYLKVYQRKDKKCLRCAGVIKRIKVNGRGTHFCDSCQK